MRRREVIAGLGAVIATCASVARAQQPAMLVVGFLSSRSAADAADVAEPFRQGLKEAGYVEGQNVAIEYRWAEGRYELLAGFAADLVQRRVNVIAALAAPAPGLAAKAATGSIPIVFQTGSDPVKDGLVARMNRPGGNVTGVSRLALNLGPKRLELLRELAPGARVIAVLVNPANRVAELQEFEIQEPARALGRTLIVLKASTAPGIDAAFAAAAEQGVEALVVANDPFFFTRRNQLIAHAARQALPVIYADRADALAGGLMSYGASLADSFRQAGIYVGRILKGEKAADLPVVQPTKFELVINLKTARALGLTIPPTLLARADEVIE